MIEALRAHERLSWLPRRNHYREETAKKRGGARNVPKRIQVDGKIYGSFRKAWQSRRISPLTLSKWLSSGKAVYL